MIDRSPIQVGGHLSAWAYGLRVVSLAGVLFAGLLFWQQQPMWAYIVLGGAVAWSAVLEGVILSRRWQRRWVEDTGEGFVFTDRQGERAFRDDQALAISLMHKNQFSQGELKSVLRTFLLWVEGEPAPLRMENRIPVRQPDPLAGMIERIIELLRQRGEEALARGQHVQGERWRLTGSELAVEQGSLPEPILLSDLTAVDVFEQSLCVWRRDQDLPIAKFPITSRNAHLLFLLLQPRIQQPNEAEAKQGVGLGRVLFQRPTPMGLRVFVALFAAAGVGLIAVGMTLWSHDEVARFWAVVAGFVLLISGVLGLWHVSIANFRCHERGVHKRGLFGERNLLYRDVERFTYAATRQFTNGAYTGTTLEMRFDPFAHCEGRAIAYSANVQNVDDDLDLLRDHISGVIAARMAEQLSQSQPVAWTDKLSFHPEGLQFHPSGMFGRKEAIFLPWEEMAGFDIQQGVLHIWRQNQDKSLIQQQSSQPNFFPGLFLLLSMNEQSEQPAEGASSKPSAS